MNTARLKNIVILILLLANAFCHNCGTTEFSPGYTLRMRRGRVLIEGCCAKCGAEVARLCD